MKAERRPAGLVTDGESTEAPSLWGGRQAEGPTAVQGKLWEQQGPQAHVLWGAL